jgi:hypothetical protein
MYLVENFWAIANIKTVWASVHRRRRYSCSKNRRTPRTCVRRVYTTSQKVDHLCSEFHADSKYPICFKIHSVLTALPLVKDWQPPKYLPTPSPLGGWSRGDGDSTDRRVFVWGVQRCIVWPGSEHGSGGHPPTNCTRHLVWLSQAVTSQTLKNVTNQVDL